MIELLFQSVALVGGVLCAIVYYTQSAIKTSSDNKYPVYTKPSIWFPLKFTLFYLLLKLRPYLPSKSAGYGKRSRSNEKAMELPQTLSNHPLAIDASYFNAYNSDGWFLGSGMQRRHNGICEAVMILRVPQLGPDVLQWPWSPANDVKLLNETEWATEQGSRFEMLEPMKKWKVSFDGELKQRGNGQIRKVKYELIWEATSPLFDMDTDMSQFATCQAIATEPWSREFFDRLKAAHQTHYEIFGNLKGSFEIEGIDNLPKEVTLRSMKDRSYGNYRNWADFHRYILHYMATEDGLFIACHLVSLPVTMSHLVVGFVMDTRGNKHAIDRCSKRLSQLGENGKPPKNYIFTVTAGGKEYVIEINWVDCVQAYCGFNWECELNSAMCNVKVNGVDGQGMMEYEYKNEGGRQRKGASGL